MTDLTAAEAAAHLRHVAALHCTKATKQAALMGAEALEATIPRQPSIPCPVCGREINLAERDKA